KADANISIKESNYTRIEVKNITGFKEIERALKYEIERQKAAVRDRVKIKPETRAWDSEKGISFALREKETEADYGYIIEPDLPVIKISREWVEKIKKGIPELAGEKLEKYEKLTKQRKIQSMAVIVKDPKLAKFFENVISDKEVNPKLASHWVELELKRVLNYNKKNLDDAKIKPENLIDIIKLIQNKRITEQTGRRLIEKLVEKEFDVDEYVKKQGLEIISDKGEIEKYCRESIKENPDAVENYKKGEEKALHFIIGQVMKKSRGKANPNVVKEIILKILGS
ncbi:MAG: Asp-tRNA(Asn)/Glu-tRNA(Gln) amidotransferase GatCAB subunit B, partial [Nanoarchaeota archaeon]|nr:Asp-tRNA(Asn)/Glu-tRNA(Gln) amidotransferase GatCAB subunit B [Nanoarchaeota archaeon]